MPARSSPDTLAAGSRTLAAAAESLLETRRGLHRVTSFAVAAGAWKGPASEAFHLDASTTQVALARTADSLAHAAATLAELSARLLHARSTWAQARDLAATAGAHLDPEGRVRPAGGGRVGGAGGGGAGPDGGGGGDPRWGGLGPGGGVEVAAMVVAGRAARLAAAAVEEATAARRVAAGRFDQAAGLLPAGQGPRHGRDGSGRDRHGGDGHGRDGHGWRRVAGRALGTGAELATATHHLAAGAEARVRGAGRLAAAADEPVIRSAAARVVETAGRVPLDGPALHALPLVAPALDLAAALSEGEPLPRALAGAVGSAVGAEVGGRVGLAVCGGQAAATQGVGLVVCPALTAVGGAVGAQAGKQAALHLYDKLAGPPDPPPARGSP